MHNGWYRKGKEQSTNEKKYAHIFWELFSRISCGWTMLKKWQAWNSVIFYASLMVVLHFIFFYCWCWFLLLLLMHTVHLAFSSWCVCPLFGHYSVYNCLTFRLFVGLTCLKNRYKRSVLLAKGLLWPSKLSSLFLTLLPLSIFFL